jgi:hypothetical protein
MHNAWQWRQLAQAVSYKWLDDVAFCADEIYSMLLAPRKTCTFVCHRRLATTSERILGFFSCFKISILGDNAGWIPIKDDIIECLGKETLMSPSGVIRSRTFREAQENTSIWLQQPK